MKTAADHPMRRSDAHQWRRSPTCEGPKVGQTIGFCRLSTHRTLARHDRPPKAMVRPTAKTRREESRRSTHDCVGHGAKWLFCLLACATLAGGLRAQEETRQQRGKRVVSEALAALGGDAFLRVEDRVETGRAYSFYNAQLSGLSVATVYTRYLAPEPGKLAQRERENFGRKQDEGFVLFNEGGAWEVNYHGAKPLEDQRLKNYREGELLNILYILRQRLSEPGLAFYSQGSDVFENQPVEIVDITDGDGRTVTVYFSKFTRLPLRQSFRRRNPTYGDFDTEVTAFSKYHPTGGIQWPYNIRRERNGDKVFEMYSETVEINQSLGDELFTLPPNVKMLPKDK